MDDIPIKMSESQTLQGRSPIVILGPNGSGKTRHAVQMANWCNADLIPALRNIALPPDVPMRPFTQATTELQNHLTRRRQRPWELSSEINELFSKLMAEDSTAATQFRDGHMAGEAGEPEITKLMKLQGAWSRLFPGRHIEFGGYRPLVRSDYATTTGDYPAQQMSDGERVALYLAGRVLDSEASIIIVDEPEVHFHSRLGTRFWNDMERVRGDMRFVYVTHDLAFALSRHDATYVVVKPNCEPAIVKLEGGLPRELGESLLAAASFSIFARRIVFCEGAEGASLDQAFYSAWFCATDTAVIPVESATNVVRCAAAFDTDRVVAGLVAQGIVDRDYWPEGYLNSLPDSVAPLGVHEVENLFCVREVFLAVAAHVGMEPGSAEGAYAGFVSQAREMFNTELVGRQVAERVKRRCEHEFRMVLGQMRQVGEPGQLAARLDPSGWGSSIESIVTEETANISRGMEGSEEDFNRYLPGKVFWKKAAEALGLNRARYRDLVCSALSGQGEGLEELAERLDESLAEYLPIRTLEDA